MFLGREGSSTYLTDERSTKPKRTQTNNAHQQHQQHTPNQQNKTKHQLLGLAPGYDPLERRNADSSKKKLSSEAAARLVAERGLPGGFVRMGWLIDNGGGVK